jgi:hypothetical protein
MPSALTASEFFKEATSSRPNRKLIFLDKYKKEEAFQLKDGTQVVFKFEKSVYDKVLALRPGDNYAYNSIQLKDNKNKLYKLASLAKSGEFGGGKGSGAGAEDTKMNESSVCLWCAVYLKYGKSDIATVIKNYSGVKNFYDVDETDKKMISQTDELWLKHYERTAKFLVDGLFRRGDYIFHRGSSLVDMINKKFSELNKKMEVPFSNINKWSPADIWVIKKGFKLDIAGCQTIDCLNRDLLNALKDRNLVGISLKKTLNSIHQTNFNVGEKRESMKWNGFRLMAARQGTNILSSKDVYIMAKGEDDIDMQLRTFDDLSGWQGELIGKVAKYGKISLGPINMLLKDLKLKEITTSNQMLVSNARNKSKDLIEELYTTFSKYADPGMTKEKFIAEVSSSNVKADYLYSKLMGVRLIDILMNTNPKTRDAFTQGALGYALSNTKNSAPFIKVS